MSIDGTISPIDRTITGIEPLAGKPAPAAAPQDETGGFLGVLKAQLDELIELTNEAEQLQQAFATGQVEDINEVILAVQKADLALNLALELRNKMVEAYQEISRMQV